MSEVIDWLESDEGWEWSRRRSDAGPMGGAAQMRRDGPIDPAEDPCGRGPSTPEQIAATEGTA